MRLTCPICGTRPLEEFTYRGDASVRRPPDFNPKNTGAWVDYVYMRDNPKGPHKEHWFHGGGCSSWLTVERDTVSHEVRSVKLARSARSGGR